MVLLKSESKRKDYKHVGGYVPSRAHSYLTLYAIAFDTTKAKVIKKLLENWIEATRQKCPDSELIEKTIERINIRWKIIKTQGNLSFDDYKKVINQELLDKGINENYIKLILTEIRK
jgi:ethanolamine utilization protein EutA (predicted chaperonin)